MKIVLAYGVEGGMEKLEKGTDYGRRNSVGGGGGGFPAACLSRGNFLINKFTRLKGRKPQEN